MTTTPRLTLADLVRGLESFGDRYHAFAVFADDVRELYTREPLPQLRATDPEGHRFRMVVGDKIYDLELLTDAGAVVLKQMKGTTRYPTEAATFGAPADLAIKTALGKKGQVATPVLGVLIGDVVGKNTGPDAPRRVFTMSFDPATGDWRAYDGGLMRWMKEQLIPRAA